MSLRTVTIQPLAARPDAVVTVPGSKSHTNRALICAALAEGRSELVGALLADDTWAMIGALRSLGIAVDVDDGSTSTTPPAVTTTPPAVTTIPAAGTTTAVTTTAVTGCGGELPAGPAALDVAQSGTTSRFILALLGLGRGPYRLDGHPQLRGRPFGPLVEALRHLGVGIEGDGLPLVVDGGRLGAGTVSLSGSVSSQFLSGLLLAAPYAAAAGPAVVGEAGAGPGVVVEITDDLVSKPYVDLTTGTMADFGVNVAQDDHRRFVIAPQRYRSGRYAIEPDASAASYFFATAAITGGRVRIPGLGRSTRQGDLGFVALLERMGATVTMGDDWTVVEGGAPLHGIEVDMADMSDVAQTLAVVATFADTPTRVTGIGFIRHKETDRVGAVVRELTRLGIRAEQDRDGFTVHPGSPRPAQVATYDDHRMAMSFALLGLVHPGITLENPDCVNKTFPRFFALLDALR